MAAGARRPVRAGRFRTLRFDNRDIGLSSHLNHLELPDIAAIVAARAADTDPALPYTLSDMVADTVGLLDRLGHDLPVELFDLYVGPVGANCARAAA